MRLTSVWTLLVAGVARLGVQPGARLGQRAPAGAAGGGLRGLGQRGGGLRAADRDAALDQDVVAVPSRSRAARRPCPWACRRRGSSCPCVSPAGSLTRDAVARREPCAATLTAVRPTTASVRAAAHDPHRDLARVAWPVSLTTVPRQRAGGRARLERAHAPRPRRPWRRAPARPPGPATPTVTSDAPTARTLPTSMSDPFRAGTWPETQWPANHIQRRG